MRCTRPRSKCSHSRGRDDAGNEVKGENPFHALGIAIDIEGNSLAEKGQADGTALILELLAFETFKERAKVAVMGTDLAVAVHHFIEKVTLIIFSQHQLYGIVLCTLFKIRLANSGHHNVVEARIPAESLGITGFSRP